MKSSNIQTYVINPLGAGDLIDRAVRFYRKNFWTFIWIAAPPIVVGMLVSVGWRMLGRELFSVGTSRNAEGLAGYYLFVGFGNLIIWLTETIAALTVMGGASRNFVRHLMFGEPITFRETYRNVVKRLGGLIVASSFITILLGFVGTFIFYFGLVFGFIAVAIAVAVFSFSMVVAVIAAIILSLGVAFLTGWLFFLIAARFAYIPQVMLVEGQGVFAAIGRSTSLASGNVKRLAALFIFTTIATYSALSLLYIPLGWYAYLQGVQILAFDADTVPAWYEIASQFIGQISFILLMPVWMVGLCLLYVDERVRHEGYDIELMAAQRLGEIPAVPQNFVNPLHPALAQNQIQNQPQESKMTTLGLN